MSSDRGTGPAPRLVSLVPSITESLVAWGVPPVACTRFCEQPGISTVGGTKRPDVAAIVALGPDLVLMCDEENRREDAEALMAAGLAIHSVSPRSVADVAPMLVELAELVGVTAQVDVVASRPADVAVPSPPVRARAFVPVWRRPWMTLAPDTYGASVLAEVGVEAVAPPGPDRYPEVTLDQVAALGVDLVVVPTEPYAFTEDHLPELIEQVGPAALVDGQDLFWWGVRTPAAIVRLDTALRPLLD